MKKIITLVFAVLLYATAASAQSDALLEAIKTAEEHQKQGRLVEAIETLTAIKPTATEELPDDFLKKPYDTKDKTLTTNEFYRKDMALQKLVNVLLETRNSGTAATTALHIENKNLRNTVLLDILNRQRAAAIKGEPELMLGKAEATALLLTGNQRDDELATIAAYYAYVGEHNLAMKTMEKIVSDQRRDRGYAAIAREYARTHHYDLVLETLKKIDVAQLDYYIIYRGYAYFHGNIGGIGYDDGSAIIYCGFDEHRPSPEYEEYRRKLIDLVQKPTSKVAALRSESFRYRQGKDDDSRQKNIELLREAADMIITHVSSQELANLPYHGSTSCREKAIETMHAISIQCAQFGLNEEAEAVHKAIVEKIMGIEKDSAFFYIVDRMPYFFYWRYYRPADVAAFIEKMRTIAEKTEDPYTCANRWKIILSIAHRSVPVKEEYKAEALEKILRAVQKVEIVPDKSSVTYRRLMELLGDVFEYVDTEEQIDALLKVFMPIALTPGNENRGWQHIEERIEWCILKYDRMLNVVYSPHIPDEWKQRGLYYQAASSIISPRVRDSANLAESLPKESERLDALKKLHDLIDDSDQKDKVRAGIDRLAEKND